MTNRYVIKIAGESGQGINVTGDTLMFALKQSGFHIFGHREYPSLIKGGNASYQIDIAETEIKSSRSTCDLLMCVSRASVHYYLPTLAQGGILLHSLARLQFTPDEMKDIERKQLQVHYVDAVQLAKSAGGATLQANIVGAGLIWGILGLSEVLLHDRIAHNFADKPQFIDVNKKCASAGFRYHWPSPVHRTFNIRNNTTWQGSLVIKGNDALALGAIAAGARAFYGYPMTPTSGVIETLAELSHQTGMIVKQTEDEITAVQMAIGSMFTGTRAFTATSGGGFDLMTETVSLAGMTETPLVIVLGQRPGPSTGMPTWTAAGDLDLAIYSGHGEFPRIVMSVNDAESSFRMIGEAFNLAEHFQVPVILLTDKQTAESDFNLLRFPEPVAVQRHILGDDELDRHHHDLHRFQVTPSGISYRWLPGQSNNAYAANSDEHDPDGHIMEEGEHAQAMFQKRMRKLLTIKQNLPEPEITGNYQAQTVLVTWGSTTTAVKDALALLPPLKAAEFQHLSFEYLFPMRTSKIEALKKQGKKFILIENNYTGKLGKLLQLEAGIEFLHKILKFDGRPFFSDQLAEQLERLSL